MALARARLLASGLCCLSLSVMSAPALAQNEIVLENALPGNPPSEWDVTGAGDASIQGFATDISVDQGGVVEFKIDTDAMSYRIDIYRLGWYGGDGARKVGTTFPSATLPQIQPDGIFDSVTRLLDCGNWGVSASWSVPADAVSGIYLAKLVRTDPEDGRASHVAFIVRDDDGASDILFQTSDTTWQAYNQYGTAGLQLGSSLYPSPGGKASKVSYNRPFTTRGGEDEDWVFNAEFPMLRWLERNGYDVSYSTGVDTDRRGGEILEHAVFLSVGHDEYWSRAARENLETARGAGVHLAFFSGNEIYWKVRWEESIDGAGTPYRTLVCYKEGTLGENQCGTKCDPVADVWTGLWRSGCEWTPPADGCEPENALSGQISWNGSTLAMQVPGKYARMPFWRNTSVASLLPNQTATLGPNTLGYEWDFEQYEASYPAGRVLMSETEQSGKTHHLSLYRHASGALVFGAGTVQWSWGLDDVHDRGNDPVDVRMQQATVNLFADMGVAPATLEAGLTYSTLPPDTTPPSSVIAFPANGSVLEGGVPITVSGTATDEEGGTVLLVEVSTDDGATWRPADGDESWTFTWIPAAPGEVTLRTRAWDAVLGAEVPGPGVTVTVVPHDCPCSLWSDSVLPGNPAENDPIAVELGVKFRTDMDGYVTGIRFYKGIPNAGTHTGNLWTSAGTLLASVVFAGETPSGWQTATFPSPVAISANTTYVASYHTTSGNYAFDSDYFATQGWDNPPLHALRDGIDGPNGVYHYGASAFPTDTYQSTNYWVDVVFDSTGVDTTPPSVTLRSPGPGALGVPVGTNVSATFNEPILASSIDVTLEETGGAIVPATLTVDAPSRTATLNPADDLAFSTSYTARVLDAVDLAGNSLAAPVVWSFTTQDPPPPPPDEGPGGPILVVADPANKFGRYFAEMLRAEGLNAFDVVSLPELDAPTLDAHSVVILGEAALDPGHVALLTDWVNASGNLIAMRPDPDLAGLLGITPAGGTLANAYVKIDTGSGPGAGLVNESIQFHGTADLYTTSGATALAMLWSDASTATPHAAVSLRSVGTNGGQAAAFAFDLARSIVTTRQGNPSWAGQERDGVSPIRSDDLFFGAAAADPQPDWIDLDKVAIPQADEQQRLLAKLVVSMNEDRAPLPRFWYFPRGEKAVVVLTGDDHSGATRERFNLYLGDDPPGCSVGEWECVRSTSYMFLGAFMTDAEAAAFQAQGFEIGLHLDTGCANWTPASLTSLYASQLPGLAALYPSLAPSPTQRHHCITWSDWATAPKTELAFGIRLDTNYYYWPPDWIQNRPGMFTGSGMPMRFADLDGAMIDVYQVATQMTDESGQSYPFTIDALLDKALGTEGYFGAFCANMHNDSPGSSGADAIIASAQARSVPIVSARQMLTWLDARNASSFDGIAWASGALSFDLEKSVNANGLEAMIPAQVDAAVLISLTRDGMPVSWRTETIKGTQVAIFSAESGAYVAVYDVDTVAPIITALTGTPNSDGTALVTWTTNEPADSRVDFGTNAGALTTFVADGALVTSHSILLTGLSPSTTYYYRATSADAEANSAVEPPPPSDPASFVTPTPPCASDATAADLAQGSHAGTLVVEETDGEVVLAPLAAAEFSGTSLPPDWAVIEYGPGGSAVVADGSVAVDGARPRESAPRSAGVSLEFRATFAAGPGNAFQHVGFAGGGDLPPGEMFNASPWALFSTGSGGAALQARVWDGGPMVDFTIPGSWIGALHRYRIDWNPSSVDFFIDGALVHTIATTIASPMRIGISDFALNGVALSVDWVRLAPYSANGTFTSHVFDGGGPVTWDTVSWSALIPAGTSLAMEARTGNTASPDGSWLAWLGLPTSGTSFGQIGRYAQVRATLATSDPLATPSLGDVVLACSMPPTAADEPAFIAPRVSALHPPSPNPFSAGTNVSFDLARPGHVTLRVFTVEGRHVRTLFDARPAPGRYQASWDGRDDAGRSVASGVYFVRLETPEFERTRKMMLLR